MAAEAGAGIRPLGDADPRTVGPYRLIGRLGSGGMGSVFAGLDHFERRVAIKIVHAQFSDDREFRARFSREVALLRRVQGTCTTPVLDADVDAPQPWFACEYVPGPTLQERVERHGPMTGDDLFALAAGLAEALVALHGVGIVHRDLKPQNVVCSPAGPRVLDLGIARSMEDSNLTRTGMMIGSPAWMSPERFRGQTSTPAADVYAWAMMVAYASTGVIPFGTGAPEVVALRVLQEDADTGGVPQALRGIVDWSADKDPLRRPSAHQVLETVTGTWRGALGAGAPAADLVSDATSLIHLHWKAPVMDGGWGAEGAAAPPAPGTGRRRAGRHAAAPAAEFGSAAGDGQAGPAAAHGFGQPGGAADGATVPAPLPAPPGVPQPRGPVGSVPPPPPLPPTPPPMPPPASPPGAAMPGGGATGYPPYRNDAFPTATAPGFPPGQAPGMPHMSTADDGDTIVGDSLAGLFADGGLGGPGGPGGAAGRRRGRGPGDGSGDGSGPAGGAFGRHRKPLIAAAAVVAAIVGVVAAVAALGDDKKEKPVAPPVAKPDTPPPGTLVGPGVFELAGLKLTIPAGWDARPNGPATVCVAPMELPADVRTDCLHGGLRVWVGSDPNRKVDLDDADGWTLGTPAPWCQPLAPGASPKPKTTGRTFQKLGSLTYEYARYNITCGDGTEIEPQVWWLPQSKISFSTGGLAKKYDDVVKDLVATMDKKSYKAPKAK
ncbi:serine/threonine-protein kinase [Yinghuangia sp. YIM S09857]|uniref:serine/threonine-protein kinase n=1 Tax=Yinghuangia sp. YIM S09857 TaxID=3436929 RepID=UPI003F5352C0